MNCDEERHGSLDGPGNLSEEALAKWIKFFLETCLDQVDFMETLVQPDRLRDRILSWADSESELLPNAKLVLEAVLYRGQLPRGDVPSVVNLQERQARRIVNGLMEKRVLVSDSSRAPLRLAFPASLAAVWMPGLFPEAPSEI